jgi:hypothetical protein
MSHPIPTRARRLAFRLAAAWLVASLIAMLYSTQLGTGVPFLHWPFALTLAWTLLSAAAGAIVLTESLRRAVRRWAAWSGKQHLRAVLVLAVLLLLVQWARLILAV